MNDDVRGKSNSSVTFHPLSLLELEITFAGVTLLMLAQLAVSDTLGLISHPLWLDECLTHLLANDPSFSHAMSALRGGVDTNPPLLYLMLRPLKWVFGTLGAVELRTFAAFFMVLAFVGVYAICRRFFDYAASWVALLSLVAHQALVEQTLEARGYSVWLAAVAWFCYCLLVLDESNTRRSRLALVAACILACFASTIHWLGILSIVIVTAVDTVMHLSLAPRAILRRLIPLACGCIALLACTPFFVGQRSALTIPTWLEPISLAQTRLVLNKLFGIGPAIVVLLNFWLWRVSGDRDAAGDTPQLWRNDLARLAPFSALLLFPAVLLIFSYLIQPAMMTRYALVSALPLGALAGWIASLMTTRAGRAVRTFLLVVLVLLGVGELRTRVNVTDIADARVHSALYNVTKITEANGRLPVVFQRRHELYPAVTIRPELAPSMALLCGRSLTVGFSYEQQMGRLVRQFYPQFRVIELSQLEEMRHFFFVVPMEAAADLNALFPDAQMRQHAPDLYEVLLREPPTSTTAPRS